MGLTVAVTGPTGEIGISAVDALEADDNIDRIIGLARRPFEPSERGWSKTEYRQGDVCDRAEVDDLVADADVVVHLAYLIRSSREESRAINLAGTRNVFEASVEAARPRRLVYASSVAAYGYYADNEVPLTEETPTRGFPEHYYSEQKAECEALLREITDDSGLEVYVLRPCIVAGPRATALSDAMPWRQVTDKLPDRVRQVMGAVPLLRPILPDPGVPMQLVHHDDVAAAITLAATGAGSPGAYNLAADGEVSFSEVAHAVGAISMRVPHAAAVAISEMVTRMPRVPAAAEWIHVARHSVVMDTSKAKRELHWSPEHTAEQTLEQMADAS